MPIKTPKFWYRDTSSSAPFIEKLLMPIACLYKIGHHLNLRSSQTNTANTPIICAGNITLGGSGKTPAIIALHKLITKNNLSKSPYFLSRGYGGSNTAPRCISVHDDANETGDEPLLLASHSKTIISVNRHQGAKMAHDLGADCILMDDGFQNPSLFKDLSFLIIDGKTGFGNKKLFPAGPLREPINEAMSRAQAIIIIGDDATNLQNHIPPNLPVFKAFIKSKNLDHIDLKQPYIGFAGLGHPQKFYNTLKENNINISDFYEFADHHPYTSKEIKNLMDSAENNNSKLITTEKDYQRIPCEYRKYIDILPIELQWNNKEEILTFLKNQFLSFKDH